MAESSLREIAENCRTEEPVTLPLEVGSFDIVKAGTRNDGSVFLWTNIRGNGPEGFVFDYTGSGYNAWSEFQLGEDCFYIVQD
jgi:hypothetical protein